MGGNSSGGELVDGDESGALGTGDWALESEEPVEDVTTPSGGIKVPGGFASLGCSASGLGMGVRLLSSYAGTSASG